MIRIPFKKYDFKITEENDKTYIFDIIRKKKIVLTPEEWVRQNILHYLIFDLNYPKNKIAVEKLFTVNQLKKRFDLLVYKNDFTPFMLIECKAPNIKIDQSVLKQAITYNLPFKADFLVFSNGNETFCISSENNKTIELKTFPDFQ